MKQAWLTLGRWDALVITLALAVAWLGACDQAGSWNDGSRLATVECLVDYHTWAIERSIFVDVPPVSAGQPSPYAPPPGLGLSTNSGSTAISTPTSHRCPPCSWRGNTISWRS